MNESHYKYVIIDSAKDTNTNIDASFTVNIAHGIQNVSRVAIKSFTMPNSTFNVYGSNTKFEWFEARKNTQTTPNTYHIKKFHVMIEPGYYTSTNLVNSINTALTAYDNRFASEAKLNITLQYDEDTYLFSVFINNNVTKYFGIFDTGVDSLWNAMGFTSNLFVNSINHNGDDIILKTYDDFPIISEIDFNNFKDIENQYFISGSSTVLSNRTITATHPGMIENNNGLYICSNKLGNDSFECSKINNSSSHLQAIPTDTIQWINIDVPKFSHISYHTDQPMWISLNHKTITNFDIQIRDHQGSLFPKDAIQNFVLVLMFQENREVEYSKDFIENYNKMGYRIGHPTR